MVLVFGVVVVLASFAFGIYTFVAWMDVQEPTLQRSPYGLTLMALALFALAGVGLCIDSFIRFRRKHREYAAWARTIGSAHGPERYVERLVDEVRERQAQQASLPSRRAVLQAMSEDGIVGKRLRRYLMCRTLETLEPDALKRESGSTPGTKKGRLYRRELRIDSGYGKGLHALWYVVGGLVACCITLIVLFGGLHAAFVVGVVMTIGLVTWAVATMLFDQIIQVETRNKHHSLAPRGPLRMPKRNKPRKPGAPEEDERA